MTDATLNPTNEHILSTGDGVDIRDTPQSVVDRYYTRYFCADVNNKPRCDQYLYKHMNELLVVGITMHHPLVTDPSPIENIEFNVNGTDRLANEVSGKKKHGAQKLKSDSVLCRVTLQNGNCYDIFSVVKGGLVQVNVQLKQNPQLLKSMAETEGWVAIVTTGRGYDGQMTNLLTQVDYKKLRAFPTDNSSQ
eukprot:CFRG6749T1